MDNKELTELLKKSLAKIQELKHKLDSSHEPIAVIGMACRYPGGANSPHNLWKLLINKTDAIIDIPHTRWDIDKYYDADKATPHKMYTRTGGFLAEDISLFDNEFFGISDAEAKNMDPQQRLTLEVVWEALESAGVAPESIKKSNTGVFMGASFNDYSQLLRASNNENTLDKYVTTGTHFSVLSGRLSYYFGLNGPAVTVDTACSASFVAIRAACQELRHGNCDMSIAGGVNLILSPESMIMTCKAGMLSPSGHCNTLDKSADGFARGEGCGIVILKRLSDAVASRDQILGIIYGASNNQNGPTTSLTAPNGVAQAQALRAALSEANKQGKDISYIELHGTGTSLGDQLEIQAITEVYGEKRDKDNPVTLGTLKTNFGHTETASGVAGLIKILLCFQHDLIPANLHHNEMNPEIHLDNIPAQYPTDAIAWEKSGVERFAAVSAFGFSGSNTHLILGDGSQLPPPNEAEDIIRRHTHIVTLSAKTQNALNEILKLYEQLDSKYFSFENLAFTTNVGRNHFDYRTFIVAKDMDELKQKIINKDYVIANISHEKKIKINFDHTTQGNYKIGSLLGGKIQIEIGSETNWEDLLKDIGELYMKGAAIDWQALNTKFNYHKILLPTYPFQRTRHWFT